MMLDRLAGNDALKQEVSRMLAGRRLSHSLLLVGEEGLGAGFAARCIAADYLYPAGGPAAEALLRGGMLQSGGQGRRPHQRPGGNRRGAGGHLGGRDGQRRQVPGGPGHRHAQRDFQHQPFGGGPGGAAVPRRTDERGVGQRPAEGDGRAPGGGAVCPHRPVPGGGAAHHPEPVRQLCPGAVPEADCAAFCAQQGVDKKTAARLSDLFEGRIGAVLDAARDPARGKQLEAAAALAKAAAAGDNYAASVLLAGYEKDKAGASALLRDFCAYAAAGLRGSKASPLKGEKAARAIQAAQQAAWQLDRQVNVKIVLQVLAADL